MRVVITADRDASLSAMWSALRIGRIKTGIATTTPTTDYVLTDKRRDFFIYVDEFQSFTTLAVANMLSEMRKYRLGFTVAHQYLHQLTPQVRYAVLGNVGTTVSFRVGADDAPYLAREFSGVFDEADLVQLPNHHVYIKLMIDGAPSLPFSAMTLPA